MATNNWNDGLNFTFTAADVGPFEVLGGRYAIAVNAAVWGGGSLTLQALMPDAETYSTVLAPFTADGGSTVDLPPGTFLLKNTGVSVQGSLVRVPYRAA